MRRCSRFYIGRIRNVMDVRWMVSSGRRYIVDIFVYISIHTVVAKIIRTLVFSTAEENNSQLFLSFAVVCQ